MNIKNIKPLTHFVFVEKPSENKSGDFFLLDNEEPVTIKSKVIAVGDGVKNVVVGDTIIFTKRDARVVRIHGDNKSVESRFRLIKEDDILAKL